MRSAICEGNLSQRAANIKYKIHTIIRINRFELIIVDRRFVE